ncbi:AAA family ATPase [Streptomyces sp. NPDC002055]|uniref:AAA family ATPase n=1 Tax=Streptomyces sp. NPDC002055 TaxID=3154534 RepID=UPI0033298335
MARSFALDWGWNVSPATAAALVAGGAYSIASLGSLTGLPASHALLVAGTGATAQAAADLYQHRPGGHITARCAAWLAAGGWTAVALEAHTPLTWHAAGWWAAGTAAGITLARGLVRAEQTARAERSVRRLQKWANGQARQWDERLTRLFRLKDHEVDGVKPWPGEVGYTVRVRMPSDTPELPADAPRKLAADLRLPRGGGVQIVDGEVHGQLQIRVTSVDVMEKDIPFPDDTETTTIYDGLALGLRPDANPAVIPVVDTCALLTGQTGSGKTNTVNVANAQALKTNDTMVMHIDTTGAGISLPWLRSWALDGDAEVPVIDWTADTETEAHILCDVLIAGIGSRKAGYQDLMDAVDDDKIPVSPDVPEVLLIVDEIAELSRPLLEKLDTIVNTGRAARVRTIICGLRATQDVITAAMKKQSRARVGMRVSDPEELHHLFPTGGVRLDPKAASRKGSGFIGAPDAEDVDTDPTPFKAYRIPPKQIRGLSPKLAPRRPRLDKVFLDTEPARFYASRWGRILPRLYKTQKLADTTRPYTDLDVLHPAADDITGLPTTGTGPCTTTAAAPTAEGSPAPVAERRRFGASALDDLLGSVGSTAEEQTSAPDGGGEAEDATVIRAAFGRVVAQAGGPADRPSPVPRLLADAHNEVVAAGGRMHTGDLAARLGMDATALGTELGELLRQVGVERPGVGTVRAGTEGKPKAGYLADTLADAIRRYHAQHAQ